MWKANNLFFDFGRGYFMERYPWAVQELLDLAGRGVVLSPMEEDWQSPDLRTWLEPLVRGPRAVDERLRILRVIRDLFLTDWGRRNAMFDNFNGTPLTTMRMLTMQRTEYQAGGPLTALAREACGLPLGEGQVTQAERVAAYARAQDVRTI
jgi:aromatic ring hydroxylase